MGQVQKSTMETRFVGLCKRWMVTSKLGTASGTDDSRLEPRCKKGDRRSGRFLEKCAQVIVKIDLVESLLRPENLEVSLRYVLKHATYGGSKSFQHFDTAEIPNHLVASRRRWLESQGINDARQENGRNEWYDLGYKGARQKLHRAPTALHRLLCLSKARRRPEKKKTIGK